MDDEKIWECIKIKSSLWPVKVKAINLKLDRENSHPIRWRMPILSEEEAAKYGPASWASRRDVRGNFHVLLSRHCDARFSSALHSLIDYITCISDRKSYYFRNPHNINFSFTSLFFWGAARSGLIDVYIWACLFLVFFHFRLIQARLYLIFNLKLVKEHMILIFML